MQCEFAHLVVSRICSHDFDMLGKPLAGSPSEFLGEGYPEDAEGRCQTHGGVAELQQIFAMVDAFSGLGQVA